MSENKQEWPWLAPVGSMPTWLCPLVRLEILRFDKSTTNCTARYLDWGSKYVGAWRPAPCPNSVTNIVADGVTEYTVEDLYGNTLYGSNDGEPPRQLLNPDAGGLKYDTGKPPLSLLDRYALEQIAGVLAFGAKKYAAHNWRKGIAYSRLSDAALRHLLAFIDGEDTDPESGLPHLAHAGCCLMFLMSMTKTRPDLDDRHGRAGQ